VAYSATDPIAGTEGKQSRDEQEEGETKIKDRKKLKESP